MKSLLSADGINDDVLGVGAAAIAVHPRFGSEVAVAVGGAGISVGAGLAALHDHSPINAPLTAPRTMKPNGLTALLLDILLQLLE